MRSVVALTLLSLALACPGRTIDEGDPPDSGPAAPDLVLCEDGDDCPERHLCRAGVCEPVGDGCLSKGECDEGLVCVAGVCASPPAECSSSDECLGDLLCNGFTHTCFDPTAAGCSTASECALEPGCAGGCSCEPDGTCLPLPAADGDAGPAAGDAGVLPGSDAGPVTPPLGDALDLSGYVIENREDVPAFHVGVIPDGTVLEPGEHLVIGRDASKQEFEGFWGVSLAANVVYLNAGVTASGVPIVNGDETWRLLTPLGTVVEQTVSGDKNRCYHRTSPGDASLGSNWVWSQDDQATPGTTLLPASGVGLVVTQWSDAGGNGNHVYEFLQLYYAP